MIRRSVALSTALVLLLASGCAARRPAQAAPSTTFGIYRGRYTAPDGTDIRFRAWIFAALPDRIHAEVVGPAGGAHWIVDGGSGRLAVTSIADAACYTGGATPDAVAAALGVKVSLRDLVAAFLGASGAGAGPGLVREPDRPGLPARFTLTSEGRVLALEKQSERTRDGGAAALGSGAVPPGVEVRPLEDLGTGPWDGSPAPEAR